MSAVFGPMRARVVLPLLVVASAATGGCGVNLEVASPTPAAAATWQAATVLPFDATRFEAAARANGVVAGDATAWVELDDGWMPVDASDGSPHYGLAAGPTGLVAWAAGGNLQKSDLGVDWVDAKDGPTDANIAAVVPVGDRLIMLGDGVTDRVGAWASHDGTAWSPLEHAPLGMAAGTAVRGGGMVAVGSSGARPGAWFTDDGIDWRAFPPASAEGTMTGVAEAAGTVVAIGNIGETPVAWRSDDLVTWTSAAIPSTDDLSIRTIAQLHGMFVICGQRNGVPTLWLSPDGRTWAPTPLPVPPGTDGTAVVMREAGGRMVVFGYATEDAGNGGSWPVAHLVWTLAP